jgi:hypothetical protein
VSARPRGFIEDWCPRPATKELLETIAGILAAYWNELPLTLRQLFYILVGRHSFEKTELAYDRLGELMNKARRARLVAMDAIRDDGFVEEGGHGYLDANDAYDSIIESIETTARYFTLDRRQCQARHIVLWCEAQGMVPQLVRTAARYDVPVLSSGGFDSLTDEHRVAKRWSDHPVTVLHLGDHDPSGVHCFSALAQDVGAFATNYGGDVEFVRLAVTIEQAERFELEPAPPKATDRRRFHGNKTFQLEALDPRALTSIVRGGIEKQLDMEAYEAVLAAEEKARQDVLFRLGLAR